MKKLLIFICVLAAINSWGMEIIDSEGKKVQVTRQREQVFASLELFQEEKESHLASGSFDFSATGRPFMNAEVMERFARYSKNPSLLFKKGRFTPDEADMLLMADYTVAKIRHSYMHLLIEYGRMSMRIDRAVWK